MKRLDARRAAVRARRPFPWLVVRLLFGLLLFVLFGTPVQADIIDFEHRPTGNLPADDDNLANPYVIGTTTVTFGFASGVSSGGITNPPILTITTQARFENFNPPGSQSEAHDAYTFGPSNIKDLDQTPNHQGGNFLLRNPEEDGIHNIQDTPFLVIYGGTLPIKAGGQIWDVDGPEIYAVEAFGPADSINPLRTLTFVGNSANDGLPTQFEFANLGSTINVIRIRRIDGDPADRGFGFDNFDAVGEQVGVPEPSTFLLGGLGALAAGGAIWRRRFRAAAPAATA